MESSREQTARDFWTHRDAATLGEAMRSGVDLVGFNVEAADGGIGQVTEATYETSRSYIVVDTGPWLLGEKVVLPAGVIDRIDFDTQTLLVDCTKDEIKNAPEFDASRYEDEGYRAELSGYYGGLGTHPVSTFQRPIKAQERRVLFYGVVSAQTEKAFAFFLEEEQAEAFIAEVEGDEPELAALLSVATVEFEKAPN